MNKNAVSKDFLVSPKFQHQPGALIAHAGFEIEAYYPALFEVLGIVRPPHLRNAVPKRQADYLAGRMIARAALREFGAETFNIGFGQDRAPVWPQGFNGSISHTKMSCAAIVAKDDMLCGIDCEAIAGGRTLDAILTKCVSIKEKAWIVSQTTHPPDVCATIVFSAKESIYKALAPIVRRFFGFECAEVQGWVDKDTLKFQLTETLHADFPKGHTLNVACRLDGNLVQTWILTPRV